MFFKKKPQTDTDIDPDIIVLKKPAPNTCGGTYATQRKNAPTEIESEDMTMFMADTSFSTMVVEIEAGEERIDSISAYAAPAQGGTFLYLCKGVRYESRLASVALVKADIMPELVKLVNEQKMAQGNGYHSNTAGLPENFGGSVDIRYASGEQISYSNNQTPIFGYDTGMMIAQVFESAMQGERVPLPDVKDLVKILFEEQRKNGGFTKAELTINDDGTGSNKKLSRYEDPKVFESEKPVEREAIDTIKKSITGCGMLAWNGLPSSGSSLNGNKRLTFVFKDGSEVSVTDGLMLPFGISGGFFNIELEMTTKH